MKYCPNCGTPVTETSRFCSQCGQSLFAPGPVAAAPARDYGPHVRLLAILFLVWGGLGLLRGLFALLAASAVAGVVGNILSSVTGHLFPPSLLQSVLMSLAWVFLGVSVAAIATGVGLLEYASWARPLALVVCVLLLLRPLLGTALGVYGLWVLASAGGERHYLRASSARG